jgi:hypothetical protein
MNATMRFVVWGTIPVGFVMGGLLASAVPIRTALILAAIACATSFLPIYFSPLRHLREIPSALEVSRPAPARPGATRPAPALSTPGTRAAATSVSGRAVDEAPPIRHGRTHRSAALSIARPSIVGRRAED